MNNIIPVLFLFYLKGRVGADGLVEGAFLGLKLARFVNILKI